MKRSIPLVKAPLPPPRPRVVNPDALLVGKQDLTKGFNEWMRRYVEEPARFRREFEVVREFMLAHDAGQEPSYGQCSAAYILKLIDETK